MLKTYDDVRRIYDLPLPELMWQAGLVHREHNDPLDIQRCMLLSIKTGSCPEDCGYCSQSAHHQTSVDSEPLMRVEEVREKAIQAKQAGASRFCLGAAWRGPKDGPQFDSVLEMVRTVRDLEMEACVTLGMLTESQAKRLHEAGLTAYNHNLDTSRDYYSQIISTRTYDDRLETLKHVGRAGISICCGGIIGMDESEKDRLEMLVELLSLEIAPESIPINCLIPIAGTPLEKATPVYSIQLIRLIATTRIAFPKARVRLSAGREQMSRELQILAFLAGANSIFLGDKLLTAGNPSVDRDANLFQAMGLPFEHELATIPNEPARAKKVEKVTLPMIG